MFLVYNFYFSLSSIRVAAVVVVSSFHLKGAMFLPDGNFHLLAKLKLQQHEGLAGNPNSSLLLATLSP